MAQHYYCYWYCYCYCWQNKLMSMNVKVGCFKYASSTQVTCVTSVLSPCTGIIAYAAYNAHIHTFVRSFARSIMTELTHSNACIMGNYGDRRVLYALSSLFLSLSIDYNYKSMRRKLVFETLSVN